MALPLSSLLIGDLAAVRGAFSEAFPRAGVECGPPRDAGAFSVVFVGHAPPALDGIATTRALRAAHPHLPIILTPAIGDDMLAAEALTSGASDYLPCARATAAALKRSVERCMDAAAMAQVIEDQRAELEHFAFALAHDFKQPIRQIRTFTKLIGDEVRAGRDMHLQQHMEFLDQAARRLGDLVDVMAEYTLLNRPPAIGRVDLAGVLHAVRVALAPLLSERGGEIIVRDAPMVIGNEALMLQVLQNLISNGLQYNRRNAPRVEVSATVEREFCVLRVADNGVGIEQEHLEDVFKPMVRLHSSADYRGAGLGLTLTRKAVTAQGGQIWCESEIGRGSRFFVKLRRI